MNFTKRQIARIACGLKDGYGAEDIALRLGLKPAHVRLQVRKFRAQGYMACIANEAVKRAKRDWQERGLIE